MYNEHFGLSQAPFRITPDTALFYTGGGRGDVLDALVYAITSGEGIVKVVGEVGTGKTMLCRMLEERLPNNVQIAYLANPSLTPQDILHAVALELELDVNAEANRLQVMHRLQESLLARHANNQRVVVLVEEAQSMPVDTLEEIRLLSNLETKNEKLLQIVLFGQPELDDNLAKAEIRQLRERITHSFSLTPLGRDEIKDYVAFRLRASGYRGRDAFTAEAYRAMSRASAGLTRRVNIIADKAMLAAFADDTHDVSAKHVKSAIADSEFNAARHRKRRPSLFAFGATAAAAVVVAGALGWYAGNRTGARSDEAVAAAAAASPTPTVAVAASAPAQVESSAVIAAVVDPGDSGAVASAPQMSTDNAAPASNADAQRTIGQMSSDPVVVAAANEVSLPAADNAALAAATPDAPTSVPRDSERPARLAPPGVAGSAAVAESATGSAVTLPAKDEVRAEALRADGSTPSIAPASTLKLSGSLREPTAPVPTTAQRVDDTAVADAAATSAVTDAARSRTDSTVAAAAPSAKLVGRVAPTPSAPPPTPRSERSAHDTLLQWRLAHTRQWLGEVEKDHYAIQLLATDADQFRNLESFLQRRDRAGQIDRIYVYRTLINSRAWYGVLFGDFASFSKAREALRELPGELQQHQPFIRNIKDISTLG